MVSGPGMPRLSKHAELDRQWRRPTKAATMPIFEYACRECHHEFEALVRPSTVPACPHCHSTQLDKQLSVVGKVGGSTAQDVAPASIGPCGSCGHPDGPGSCAVH
jgi:putative FmdB family regulatory protein